MLLYAAGALVASSAAVVDVNGAALHYHLSNRQNSSDILTKFCLGKETI